MTVYRSSEPFCTRYFLSQLIAFGGVLFQLRHLAY